MTFKKPVIAVLPLMMITLLGIQSESGSSGTRTPDLLSLSDGDLKTATVRFDRRPCFGSCPAYSLTIHGDGRVEYSGRDHVKTKGTQEGHVDQESFKKLMSEFARAKFFSIADDYSDAKCKCSRRCTDMPSAISELTVAGTSHRVDHYYGCGCAPKALFELESSIDKAVRVEQWIGDVSKQGPYGTTCFGP